MTRFLLLVALLCAVVSALIGFFGEQDQFLTALGWLAAGFALSVASELVD